MATLLEWDGGTLPTITGTTPSVIDAHTMEFAAGSALNYASWTTSADRFTLRYYVTIPSAWTSASWTMGGIQASGNQNARINLGGSGSPGQFRWVRAGNVQFAQTTSNTVVLNEIYRVEVQIDRVAQTYRAGIFQLLSTTPIYDSTLLTSIDTGSAAFTEIRLGIASSGVSVGTLRIGRIMAVDTVGAWIGPHISDVSGGGPSPLEDHLALWNGAAATPATIVGYWDGASVSPVITNRSEVWVWRYDWTANEWTTPPATRPWAEVIRVLASGPIAPPNELHADWMGDSPEEWEDGKAIVHYLAMEVEP